MSIFQQIAQVLNYIWTNLYSLNVPILNIPFSTFILAMFLINVIIVGLTKILKGKEE